MLAGTATVFHTDHFNLRLEERGYSMLDVRRVLQGGGIEEDPEPILKHRNHTVLVRGRSWDERDTRIVLGLRATGPNYYISIVDIEHVGPPAGGGK
jgi:hypothetical protein